MDEESDAELVIDDQAKEKIKDNAATGETLQSSNANASATPMDADAQIAMLLEQEETLE